jgi:type II secretory pathway pseudopilin PulG
LLVADERSRQIHGAACAHPSDKQPTNPPNALKIRSVTSTTARRPAFTRIELVIIIAVLGVLVALLLPAMVQASRKAKRISCTSCLKHIGLSFRIFANDHTGRFPMQVWPDASLPAFILGAMSNELSTPVVLTCPADKRKSVSDFRSLTASNISYFVGLNSADEYPQSFLAGDRNLTTNGFPVGPGLLAVTTNTILSWSATMHGHLGNLALGDGGVRHATESTLKEFNRHQGIGTNWLAMP